MGRFIKQTKSGRLRVNWAKLREEERLDGRYLLSTSDDTLSAEDVALGYKLLMEVELAFRTLKTTLELRPLYHRKDERIQAHVLFCYLALLPVRIAERETGETWDRIHSVMGRCHLGVFSSIAGEEVGTSTTTAPWEAVGTPTPRNFRTYGTKGSLRVSHYANKLSFFGKEKQEQIRVLDRPMPSNFALQMASFAKALLNGTEPEVTGLDGLKALQVALAANASF